MVKAGFGQLFCCHPHILDSCDALGFTVNSLPSATAITGMIMRPPASEGRSLTRGGGPEIDEGVSLATKSRAVPRPALFVFRSGNLDLLVFS
jgi:hypothetical protein